MGWPIFLLMWSTSLGNQKDAQPSPCCVGGLKFERNDKPHLSVIQIEHAWYDLTPLKSLLQPLTFLPLAGRSKRPGRVGGRCGSQDPSTHRLPWPSGGGAAPPWLFPLPYTSFESAHDPSVASWESLARRVSCWAVQFRF